MNQLDSITAPAVTFEATQGGPSVEHITMLQVVASRRNPSEDWPNNFVEFSMNADRTAANAKVRAFLASGYWVEVFGMPSCELLAGPFDPDSAFPTYIL